MNKINDKFIYPYLAGFLDGDGSVNAQIVQRDDYILKFQIRFIITFFQSTKRHWFIIWLDKTIKTGVIRKRNDGISEYTLIGIKNVRELLINLLPYLIIKKRQANLVLSIMETYNKNQKKEEFLKLCKLVDQISLINDSKKRFLNSNFVEKIFDTFPVETSED